MGRFSSLLASILVPPSLDFEASSLDFEPSRLASGASWPAAFLWLCFTQLPAAMNVRNAKIPKTCQEKDISHKWPDCQRWGGGGDPPRGFQWNKTQIDRRGLPRASTKTPKSCLVGAMPHASKMLPASFKFACSAVFFSTSLFFGRPLCQPLPCQLAPESPASEWPRRDARSVNNARGSPDPPAC